MFWRLIRLKKCWKSSAIAHSRFQLMPRTMPKTKCFQLSSGKTFRSISNSIFLDTSCQNLESAFDSSTLKFCPAKPLKLFISSLLRSFRSTIFHWTTWLLFAPTMLLSTLVVRNWMESTMSFIVWSRSKSFWFRLVVRLIFSTMPQKQLLDDSQLISKRLHSSSKVISKVRRKDTNHWKRFLKVQR